MIPRPFFAALTALAFVGACTHVEPEPFRPTPAREPAPKSEPAPKAPRNVQVRLTRRCEQLQRVTHDNVLDQARSSRAELKKIAPATVRYDFSPNGKLVLYADSEVSALYAVPISGGPARRLSPEGHMVASWLPDPHDPDRVIYQELKRDEIEGRFFSVSLTAPGGKPSPAEDPGEARLKPLRGVLGRHGYRSVQFGNSSVDLWGVSEGLGVAGIGGPAENIRLFAVDARSDELRPLMPPDMRNLWSPMPLDERRIVFEARDGHLYVSNLDTSELSCASANLRTGFELFPFFATSSDHRLLAYASWQSARQPLAPFELHVVDLVEGVDHLVFRGTAYNIIPIALPGTHTFAALVRLVERPGQNDTLLYTFDASSPPVRLTDPLPSIRNVFASPDGKHLLFSRGGRNPYSLPSPLAPPPPDGLAPSGGPPSRPPLPPGLPSPNPPVKGGGLPMNGPRTCDPVGCRGCGWQNNGCGQQVWCGECPGAKPLSPPPDPQEGLYLLRL